MKTWKTSSWLIKGAWGTRRFDCLDLRLSYELGWICCYAKISVDDSRVLNLPYVLISHELHKALKESVKRSPSILSVISRDR